MNIIKNSRLNANYSKKESNAKKTELKHQKRESQVHFIPILICSRNRNSLVCEKRCFSSKLGKLSFYDTFHFKSTPKIIHAYTFYT